MDIHIQKAIRNGIWPFVIMAGIIFIYGGIYTEMLQEGLGFSLGYILLALLGSLIGGVPFFLLSFVVSLIYFYFKSKKFKS